MSSAPANPSVSVIVPAYNRLEFLRPAVESVYAQTHTDWELIVADDGSGEETAAYLRSIAGPRVRVLWLTHSGNPSQVRNAAIAAAGGRYLAFLDSDDIWAPTKLEKQLTALRERANSRWSYTACDSIDGKGAPLPKKQSTIVRPEGWIFEQLLRLQIGIAMPTVVAERSLVIEAGGFDQEQLFGEFHDLCLRLALHGEVVAVSEPLCSVRTHDDHYSSDRVGDQAGWMRLYEKMANLTLDRRLRAHCARMRAHTSLRLAGQQSAIGDHRAAWSTLRVAVAHAWRYPQWWWGALKAVIRPFVPQALVSADRRSGSRR